MNIFFFYVVTFLWTCFYGYLSEKSFFLSQRVLVFEVVLDFLFYQVFTKKLVRSDKFKTGKEQYLDKEILIEDKRDTIIGRIPVMVKSDLCWMKGAEKGDCDFDHGGYFLIKGAEKVSLKLTLFSSV